MSSNAHFGPEHWERLKLLFDLALRLDPAERERFLDRECAGDEDLRRQVQRLIEHNEQAGSFLEPGSNKEDDTDTLPHARFPSRFRVVRFLGRGGMGEVYEAEDRELGVRVALKTLRPEFAGNPVSLARFKREVQLARKITHPNVCRIHEFFTVPADLDSGSAPMAFLSMEYLAGESLAARLRRDGPLVEAEAGPLALQLCSALEAAHRAGVVHRDFKSANVMVVPSENHAPRAVVTDFGLARDLFLAAAAPAALSRPGAVMGTPGYMAPEQMQGGPVGPAGDIYALGVVLHEMVAGRRPLSYSAPEPVPFWGAIIERCLQQDPGCRPASAGEVAALIEGASQPAVRKAAFPRFTRRGGVIASAAVGAALIAMAAWARWDASDYRPPSPDAQHWYDQGTAALHEGTYLKASRALERSVNIDKRFALAHARLADAFAELDYIDKAKDEMLKASSLEAMRGLPPVDREYVEAVRATLTNDFAGAVQLYQHIVHDVPAASRAYAYVDLGRAWEKGGKIPAALDAYSKAASEQPEYPASFVHLGILESRLKHNDQAEAAFNRAEALYRASSNLEGLSEVDYQRGLAASDQGRLETALAFTEKALDGARAIHSVQLEIRALLLSSGIDHRSGSLEGAEQRASQAIQLARDNGIAFWSTQGLVLLGNPYLISGDYAKAEYYFQEALALARKSGSQRLEAMALLSIASLRNQQGRPQEVIPAAQPALAYYREVGNVTNAHKAALLLARAQRDLGHLDDALRVFKEQVELGRKAHDPNITAHAEEGIGGILERMEQYPEALLHYRAAMEAGKELGPEFLATEAKQCAGVLADLGRYAESEEMLKRAEPMVAVQRDLAGEIARIKAFSALTQGRDGHALRLSREALASKRACAPGTAIDVELIACLAESRLGHSTAARAMCREALTRALNPLQRTNAMLALSEPLLTGGSLEDAKNFAQTAANDFRARGQRDSEWRSLLLLARIYERQNDTERSKEFASESLDILNQFGNNWEAADGRSYRNRPDVEAGRRKLLTLVNEKRRSRP